MRGLRFRGAGAGFGDFGIRMQVLFVSNFAKEERGD